MISYARGDRFAAGSPLDLVLLVTLGGAALGVGLIGVLGARVIRLGLAEAHKAPGIPERDDIHAHRCDTCGNTWRHTGRASHGSEAAHTCARCGSLQWWRPGEREFKMAKGASHGAW